MEFRWRKYKVCIGVGGWYGLLNDDFDYINHLHVEILYANNNWENSQSI